MPGSEQPPRRRRGLLSPFVWAGRSVVQPLALPEIRAQAETIRGLHGVLRSRGASSGPALVLDADRRFDLQASAEALDTGRIAMEHYAQLGGVQAGELAVLLQRRRAETARAARLNLAFALLFVAVCRSGRRSTTALRSRSTRMVP